MLKIDYKVVNQTIISNSLLLFYRQSLYLCHQGGNFTIPALISVFLSMLVMQKFGELSAIEEKVQKASMSLI